jgi:hypothetical protein
MAPRYRCSANMHSQADRTLHFATLFLLKQGHQENRIKNWAAYRAEVVSDAKPIIDITEVLPEPALNQVSCYFYTDS